MPDNTKKKNLLWSNRTLFRYVLADIFPTFFVGLIIFIFILLSFQTLRLTEYLLIHGVSITNLAELVLFMSVRFLPMLLPMSLLFACLFTYNRMSNDSETVALKACGLSQWQISTPAIFFGLIVFAGSLYTSFYIGPWGTRSFENLLAKIGQSKASANIKEGSFSEGFYDMVVYANKVDTKTGRLANLFIYDERNASAPLTIVAKYGQVIEDESRPNQSALLRLLDGEIHKDYQSNYTIVNFKTYDISLSSSINFKDAEFSPDSYDIHHLSNIIEHWKTLPEIPASDMKQFIHMKREYHRRWALSFSCIVFTLLGVSIGSQANRRNSKSNGYLLSLAVIIAYWILFIFGDQAAKSGKLPAYISLWGTNIVFMYYAFHRWKISSRI